MDALGLIGNLRLLLRDHGMRVLLPVAASLGAWNLLFTISVTDAQEAFLAVGDAGPQLERSVIGVVLGCECDHWRAVPSDALRRRVNTAVAWAAAENHTKRALLFSGGLDTTCHPAGLPAEADIMQATFLDATAASTSKLPLLIEARSTSTRTNAIHTLSLLQDEGYIPADGALHLDIVTSSFHQKRALWTFDRAYRDVVRSNATELTIRMVKPVEADAGRLVQWHFWRELAAILYYYSMGYV